VLQHRVSDDHDAVRPVYEWSTGQHRAVRTARKFDVGRMLSREGLGSVSRIKPGVDRNQTRNVWRARFSSSSELGLEYSLKGAGWFPLSATCGESTDSEVSWAVVFRFWCGRIVVAAARIGILAFAR